MTGALPKRLVFSLAALLAFYQTDDINDDRSWRGSRHIATMMIMSPKPSANALSGGRSSTIPALEEIQAQFQTIQDQDTRAVKNRAASCYSSSGKR